MKLWARYQKLIIVIVASIVTLLVIFYLTVSIQIGNDVKKLSQQAMTIFPEARDHISALMAWVDSHDHPFTDRNQAVWALGQMGNEKALPILKKYFTGEPCNHDKYLCQQELKKAIQQANGSCNVTAFIWRKKVISELED